MQTMHRSAFCISAKITLKFGQVVKNRRMLFVQVSHFFKSRFIFKFTFRNSRYNEKQKDSHSGRVNGKKGAITYETSKKTVWQGSSCQPVLCNSFSS
jgi:hypothetical protein